MALRPRPRAAGSSRRARAPSARRPASGGSRPSRACRRWGAHRRRRGGRPPRTGRASAARRSSFRSADGARIGVGATEASTMRAAAMVPSASRRSHAPAPAMAMSISRRGVKRRYFAAERGCGGGSRIETSSSPGSSARAAGSANSASTGTSRLPLRPRDQRPRLVADQRRNGIRRRGGIADVAAEARPVLDLHAADQPRRLGDGRDRRAATAACRATAGRSGRGADRDAAVRQRGDRRQLGDALEVDDARRPAGAPRAAAGSGRCRRQAPRASPAAMAATASSMVAGLLIDELLQRPAPVRSSRAQ